MKTKTLLTILCCAFVLESCFTHYRISSLRREAEVALIGTNMVNRKLEAFLNGDRRTLEALRSESDGLFGKIIKGAIKEGIRHSIGF